MAVCLHLKLTRRLHPDSNIWEAVVECLQCGSWRSVKLKATFGPFRQRKNASAGSPVRPSPGPDPAESFPEEEPPSPRVTGQPSASSLPPPGHNHTDDPVAHMKKCPACGHKAYDKEMFKTREMLKERDICKACAVAFPQLIHPSELQRLMDLRITMGVTKVG